MANWNDLSELEQLQSLYSDAHKDAYGFRPRDGGVHCPVTVEDYNRAIDKCVEVMIENDKLEQEAQAAAVVDFEKTIDSLIAIGAGDREGAIRWYLESEGFDPENDNIQDVEMILEYRVGLPRAYVREAAEVIGLYYF